jgi:hypothetical protein
VSLDHCYALPWTSAPSVALPNLPADNLPLLPSPYLAQSLALAEKLIGQGIRESTSRKYSQAYTHWIKFCDLAQVSPLPATTEHVCACLAQLASETHSVATVESVYASISYMHRSHNLNSPTSGPAVALLMRSIRRQFQKPRRVVKPLTLNMLRTMLDHLYQPSHGSDGLRYKKLKSCK